MDYVATLGLIRVLTDAVHNNVPGLTGKLGAQLTALFLSAVFTLGYNLHPLPPFHSTLPYLEYVERGLDVLVVWLGAMGADNLLKALQLHGDGAAPAAAPADPGIGAKS